MDNFNNNNKNSSGQALNLDCLLKYLFVKLLICETPQGVVPSSISQVGFVSSNLFAAVASFWVTLFAVILKNIIALYMIWIAKTDW